MTSTYDYLFKVVLIGDSGVGKSSLLSRYRNGEFNADTKQTIGVEFATQELEVEGKQIKIQIWDTAGQERYRAITKAYYRGALGAIVLYDMTQPETFASVEKWLAEIRSNASEDIKVMMVGNKSDLVDERKVSIDEATKFARDQTLAFLEASAKSGDLVQQCFETVVQSIFREQRAKEKVAAETKELVKEPEATKIDFDQGGKGKKNLAAKCCKVS